MEIKKNIPFDPLAWANASNNIQEPQQAANEMPVQAVASASQPALSEDIETQVRNIARMLIERGIDITKGYTNWLNLGFALAEGLGENVRDVYHDLSHMNSDYDADECNKQYDACIRSRRKGITIKTFFMMAKDAGIDLSQFAKKHHSSHSVYATSANMPNAKNNENIGKYPIFDVFDSRMADGGMAEVAENASSGNDGYTFSDKLKKADLPGFLHPVYDLHCAEPAKNDAQLLGVIGVVGGMMGGANGTPDQHSGIYGIYDGRRVYAPLFNIIYSSAGNDKGNLIFCKRLLQPIKQEMRAKYDAEKEAYEEAKAEWEAKGKKERGPAPKEPTYLDPFLPGNSSSSAVYRALEANGGWGVMFETEADTISSMMDSDYGNYSDLLRKAHHHETISMSRVSEKLHIDIDEPRLSVFLTCTPGQLSGLFHSFENGLGSRFLFYNTPDEDVHFHDVFAHKDTPLVDTYKKLGDELLPLYHAMLSRTDHPIQFVMSQRQQCVFLNTYREILSEQFEMLGKGIRAFIFRMALECFRYAMILTTLRRLSEWKESFDPADPDQPSIFHDDENALVCDDRDFNTAMTIMGCLINHTARVYAILANDSDDPFATSNLKLKEDEKKLYQALPEGEFHTADFLEIANGMNIPDRTAQRYLSQFSNVYQIISPVRRGIYKKRVNSTPYANG